MTLNADRIQRYNEKMGLERDGVYYRVATAVDASMDVVAMVVKDTGLTVGDDYGNINALVEHGTISKELGAMLKKCNAVQNALIHKYNRIRDDDVLASIVEVQEIMFGFIARVEAFLDEHGRDPT